MCKRRIEKEEKNKMMSTGEEEKMMMMMMVPRWLMMGREKKEALTPEVLREVTLETSEPWKPTYM